MDAHELASGLWHWTARHPDWTPEEGGPDGWHPDVSSYALVAEDGFVLFDPLAPPDGTGEAERFWRAVDVDAEAHGPPHVLLTIFWHARSSRAVAERYPGARVWVHEPAEETMRERTPVTDVFRLGDELPAGVELLASVRGGEMLFWIPEHAAVVAGDVLLGTEEGGIRVCPDSWLGDRTTPQEVRNELSAILDRPLERVLLTHGEPVLTGARDALMRALETA